MSSKAEDLTDEELDELMMEQSKTPGCKKHRGYGKFDKPSVNRGIKVKNSEKDETCQGDDRPKAI